MSPASYRAAPPRVGGFTLPDGCHRFLGGALNLPRAGVVATAVLLTGGRAAGEDLDTGAFHVALELSGYGLPVKVERRTDVMPANRAGGPAGVPRRPAAAATMAGMPSDAPTGHPETRLIVVRGNSG